MTGTNGKTTTVELLGHVYRSAGEPVAVAGNVGTPLSELVGQVEPDATVVCEASSFQLEDTSAFAPECAVFLNLAPDHLDRHRDLEAYLAAKLRIFANQGDDDVAVYDADDPALAGVDLGGCARRLAFCRGAAPDCEVRWPRERSSTTASRCSAVDELGLFGEHDVANAMAAAAAALSMGSTARRCARACAASPASRTASSRSPRSAASASSTTPRRRTSHPPRSASAPSTGGVRAILGGSEKGEPFAPLLDPSASTASPVT